MALSDFFPYGAPELLKGAAARMARSTLGSSLGVALTIVALGVFRPTASPVVIEPIPERDPYVILPPPEDDTPPRDVPYVPPAQEQVPENAPPEIVPDDIAEPKEVGPVEPDARPGEDPTGREPAQGRDPGGVPPEADPDPNQWIPVDEMPSTLHCAKAFYPDLARAAGVEGTVLVRMLVGLDGRVERAIVAPGGSVLLLDEAALEAALTCVFTPALAKGRPVRVWVSQAYRFTLH
jgi:protein TonB